MTKKEVKHVFLALDLTEKILDEALDAGADMIITHHPMIFGGVKKINNHDFTGRKILSLTAHDIQYFAMHTNYDVIGYGRPQRRLSATSGPQGTFCNNRNRRRRTGIWPGGKLPKVMTLR